MSNDILLLMTKTNMSKCFLIFRLRCCSNNYIILNSNILFYLYLLFIHILYFDYFIY